jgi:hypothetical protein
VWDTHSTPLIYIGGVLKTTPTDYSIGSTGLVTFTSPPASAAVLTWTGTYYRRVRFEEQSLSAERIFSGLWEANSIPLLSVKP